MESLHRSLEQKEAIGPLTQISDLFVKHVISSSVSIYLLHMNLLLSIMQILYLV